MLTRDLDAFFRLAFAISIGNLDPSEGALPTVPSATVKILHIALKSFVEITDASLIHCICQIVNFTLSSLGASAEFRRSPLLPSSPL